MKLAYSNNTKKRRKYRETTVSTLLHCDSREFCVTIFVFYNKPVAVLHSLDRVTFVCFLVGLFKILS